MINRSLLFSLALLLACSCNHPESPETKKPSEGKIKLHAKTTLTVKNDTLLINQRTAVLAMLDSAALEKNRKKYGDTAVDTYTEDGSYYDYVADSVLKQKKLPVLQTVNFKYIKFVQNKGVATIVRIDTLSQVSTLYFFDPNRAPHVVDVTDIENEYKNYFR